MQAKQNSEILEAKRKRKERAEENMVAMTKRIQSSGLAIK